MNVREVRDRLLEMAANADLPAEAEMAAGMRKVDFAERGPAAWEFGLIVFVRRSEALDDFDDLLSGPRSLKNAIEADRELGGLAMDTRVARVVGPRSLDGSTSAEWLIQVIQEET